jgi:hypothetical protein
MERRTFAKLAAAWGICWVPLASRALQAPRVDGDNQRRRLDCQWQARKNGSYICDLTDGNHGPFDFGVLFINGNRQTVARFPDADPSGASTYVAGARFFPSGIFVPDFGDSLRIEDLLAIEFDPATFSQKRWGDPELATLCLKHNPQDLRLAIHALDYDHNLIWCLRPKERQDVRFEGIPHFYVENVFEEMNAPHEWYLDRKLSYLYYRPPGDVDMSTAIVEVN